MTTAVVHLLLPARISPMTQPEGTLTPAQHEILEAIWSAPENGATVTEIWQAIGQQRGVTRTTVLNQVDRLEKRGWLKREKHADGFRYVATRTREQVASGLAVEFVDSFFGGSAEELLMSLLGSKRLKPSDIARLKALLETRASKRNPS
jgi:BlaI family transcriptional regulator, penicillinase repressor